MPLCFEHFTFDVSFFFWFRLLAITGDGLISQNIFLVATIRFIFQKRLRLDDAEDSGFRKEFSEQMFMDKYCVWC